MISVMLLALVCMGAAYVVVLLFLKVIFKKQVGTIVSGVVAILLLICTSLLQLFLTDVFFGIGPEIADGKIPAPSALKYAFISGFVAAYIAWIHLKKGGSRAAP